MAQTLFKLLKIREPQTEIEVLAPAWSQPLLTSMPEVRRSWIASWGHGELQLAVRFKLAQQLRSHHYDQAIVLPNSLKSALIPFLARIPQRTGWRGELRWGLLNDIRALDKAKYPLMIQRFAALALPPEAPLPESLPWPALVMDAAAERRALEKFALQSLEQPVLGICPGAEYGPAKRWPTEHFATLVNEKVSQGWQVWILGSVKESPLAAAIQERCNHQARDFTGQTTLAEVLHLIQATTAIVTNDSGLMHMAAALRKPLVALYGSSSPVFTPPLAQRVEMLSLHLPCSPCFKRECPLGHLNCLRHLTPAQVMTALETVCN